MSMIQEHSQADDSEDAAGPLLIQKLEVSYLLHFSIIK